MLDTLPQDKPALYYSNARIVDESGNYIRLCHDKPNVAKNKYAFMSQPLVQGCTCVYNKELAKIIWKMQPTAFSMHDTYLYTVGAMFGNLVYDYGAHMSYRQHGNNVIGVSRKKFSFEQLKRQMKLIFKALV